MSKKTKNIFVIGDVHGCYHTLVKLVEKLPKKAELIFVGDLCDRGNFSRNVIDFVMKMATYALKEIMSILCKLIFKMQLTKMT